MITVKMYADEKGVSTQAVYKQLQTHAEELEPHIVTQGRTRYLTEEAVAILEKYRETNVQIVERTNDKELIEELRQNIQTLLAEQARLSQELAAAYKQNSEQSLLLAQAERDRLLLEQKTATVESMREDIRSIQREYDELDEQRRWENKRYQDALNEERTRSLTWQERLFGRKLINDSE